MARGRKTSLTIILTPAERQTLRAWQRATIVPSGVSRRARMILLLAEGRSITAIAATVGISRRFVYKWAQRFLEQGVEGLADKPGRGRVPRQATPAGAARHGAARGSLETARVASKAQNDRGIC
jgi:transposase